MEHTCQFVVGDDSEDGHGKIKTFLFKTNLNVTEIHQAYRDAVQMVGFDFTSNVACDYQDNNILMEDFELLKSKGIDVDLSDYMMKGDTSIYLSPENYLKFYLKYCKLGNPEFEYEEINTKNKIDIGGYGLL